VKTSLENIPQMEYYGAMPWNGEHTDEFAEWWRGLAEAQHEDVTAAVLLLMDQLVARVERLRNPGTFCHGSEAAGSFSLTITPAEPRAVDDFSAVG
jgi:hypothetical protein